MIEKIKAEIKRRISVFDRRIENNLYKIDTTGMEEIDAEYHQHTQNAKLTIFSARACELEDLLDKLAEDKDEDDNGWTIKDDPRVTGVGRFLRRTSIDELPQLFNVFAGKMSLVGPRPERPMFVEQFRESIPRYMVKHQVRPGITGWAQVNGLRGDTSISERIKYDIYYIENWTIWFDIKIMFLTVFKGFVNKNAY